MTTLDEAKEAILDRFISQWGTTSPFVFENEKPDNLLNLPWVRVSFRELESRQETLGRPGNRRFLRRVLVFIQVFTKLNIGSKPADLLANTAKNIFEATTFSGLWFLHATIQTVGVTQDGMYQVNVECECNFQELK